MTAADHPAAATAELALSESETAAIAEVARPLARVGRVATGEPGWIGRARGSWEDLPDRLRRRLRRFRRSSGPTGTLVIRGLPAGDATPAPRAPGAARADVSASVLVMLACGLGDPAAFWSENHGALVHDVVPTGDLHCALLRNDKASHRYRPDHVMLLCLRSDAALRIACIREALPMLTPRCRQALFSEEFATMPPRHDWAHPVLSGAPDDPWLRLDLGSTRPRTDRAAAALAELGRVLDHTSRTVHLRPGDVAVLDNRVTAHALPHLTAGHWLQRTFVLADLHHSRHYRPRDGYVLGDWSESPVRVGQSPD